MMSQLKIRKPEAVIMSTFISLINYTERGIQKIRKSPERLDAAKTMLEEMGGKFVKFYLIMGQYDIVLIYEAPDDAVSARFQLLLGEQGFIRTSTMKAFPETAYRELMATL